MRKLKKVIYIGLYQPELDVVNKIEHEQELPVPEVIRLLIRQYGQEHWPKEKLYALNKKAEIELRKMEAEQKMEWEKISPEEYATKELGMRVVGGYAWSCTPSGPFKFDLSEIKNLDKNNPYLKTHRELLNGTYKDPLGRPWWGDAENAEVVEKYHKRLDEMDRGQKSS